MRYLYLFLLSLIPSIIILTFVYLTDKEKEPKGLLVKLFLGGIGACFLTVLVTFLLEAVIPFLNVEPEKLVKTPILQFLYCFILIGVIEEASKWVFEHELVWNSKEFDQLYDSIVYAVFVSLGFATFENIFYVLEGGTSTAIARSLTSVPAHASFGIIMGYYMGMAKLTSLNGNHKLSSRYKFLSIFLPSLVHGFYDFCLYSQNLFLLFIFVGFLIFIYVGAIQKIKQFKRVKINL